MYNDQLLKVFNEKNIFIFFHKDPKERITEKKMQKIFEISLSSMVFIAFT